MEQVFVTRFTHVGYDIHHVLNVILAFFSRFEACCREAPGDSIVQKYWVTSLSGWRVRSEVPTEENGRIYTMTF